MKKALAILVFAALSSPMIGQTTSITAVVTDSNSVNWVNATCTATWIGTGKAIDLNGKSFTTKPTCTVDSSANLTVTVQDVAYIAPPASTWRFCVTPATSQAVTGCTNIAATGASESITTQITAAITPPNVTGGILAQAYADSEVQAVGGNMYYNIVTPAFRCYSTSWATCGGGSGGGSVTSVGLSSPGVIYSVSGSPVTSSGTLALNLINQSANTILAGPSTGSAAAPSFRALVTADIPTGTSGGTIPLNNGNLTLSGNDVFSASAGVSTYGVNFSGAPITSGCSGTTCFPLVTIGNGAAPTTYSTGGTMVSINSPSGFSGRELEIFANGALVFSIDDGGNIATSAITGTALTATSLNQKAASNYGGTCAMSSGTSCTVTIGHSYTTPVCIVTQQSATLTGGAAGCTVSGATVTVTAATANSETWGVLVFGNPT